MSLTSKSALPPSTAAESSQSTGAASAAVLLLVILVACHFFVDLVACMVTPLWPDLERHYGLQNGVLILYVIWSVTTSFCQLLFGYLSDRYPSRQMIWLGPLMAVICLSCLGLTQSPVVAALLLVGGGLGVAAFHPEAAATAGSCAPQWRSRAMSLFAMGGYLGQAIGPTYSGWLTEGWSLAALAVTTVWGAPVIALILWGLRGQTMPAALEKPHRVPLGEFLRRDGAMIARIVGVATLRVIPALGAPLALAFLLKAQLATTAYVGLVQSSFLGGVGLGGCLCALWMRRSFERTVLWAAPLVAAPALAAIPMGQGYWQFVPSVLSGVCTGVSMPVLISYGQQLLPGGQRVASSLTMGVSWGIGGVLVAGLMSLFKSYGAVEQIFWVFACSSVLSGLAVLTLPRVEE